MANGEWVSLMREAELAPGAMRCFELGKQRILLAHCRSGSIYAADELCTHEDASLCLGALDGTRVKCPLHGSWFDLRDGSVEDEPAEVPLAVYAVRVRDGIIQVQLGTDR